MRFIKDIKETDAFREIYLIKSVNKSTTTSGKAFWTLTLQDKTGTISAKKWDVESDDVDIFKVGQFIDAEYEATTFKDKIELKIHNPRHIEVRKYDDYLPTSPIAKEVLKEKLENYLNEISNPNLQLIVKELYEINKEEFLVHPAAAKMHHAFISGLLYHTVSMLDVASFLAKHYANIDKDLIYAGVFAHDLGKLKELSGLLPIEYTLEGQLLGHLVLATNMIHEVALKHHLEKDEKILLLEHMILASHGKYEYGSPVLGMTKEAIMLNFIDDLDAKMMIFDMNTKELEPGEFTNRLMSLDDRRLYKKK